MALRMHCSSCCLLLLAMAAMFYSGQAYGHPFHGLNLCQKADYPALCRSVVKGLGNPYMAIESAIHQLIFQTQRAKVASQRSRSQVMEVCTEVYDDAVSNLETCLSNLKSHDKPGLNINLSAALTDYVTCDDAVSEGGLTSPITRTNVLLRQMASNCLYLSSLFRL